MLANGNFSFCLTVFLFIIICYIYTVIYSILNYLSFSIKFRSFFLFFYFNEKLCYLPQWGNTYNHKEKKMYRGQKKYLSNNKLSFTSSTSSLCRYGKNRVEKWAEKKNWPGPTDQTKFAENSRAASVHAWTPCKICL